jgi:hypothetical protein
MPDLLLALVTLLLLGAEWRWRLGFLRLLVAGGAAVLILASRDLGPPARRTIGTTARVTRRWDRDLNPYVSGVLTMKREAEADLSHLSGPVAVLVWLSVSPLLPPVGRRPGSRRT